MRADSCAIFRIGPCQGIRMCWDASVLGLQPCGPWGGNEIEYLVCAVPQMTVSGAGYTLPRLHPADPSKMKRKLRCVEWTFHPLLSRRVIPMDYHCSMYATFINRAEVDESMFLSKLDSSIGLSSWFWPEGQISKQKLASCDLSVSSDGGAHMPLMVDIGGSSQTRRRKRARAKKIQTRSPIIDLVNRLISGLTWSWPWEMRLEPNTESDNFGGAEH